MSEITNDLTILESRDVLHCSNPTIWSLINKGELSAYYVGRTIRITRDSLKEFKERNKYIPRKKTA